jgi:hypothetical protein
MIKDKAFVSTSTDLKVALDFSSTGRGAPVLFRIEIPKGASGLVVKGNKFEREVLLNHGSSFRVTDVHEVNTKGFKGVVVSAMLKK